MENTIDLFDDIESLPQEVQEVLSKHLIDDETYENCSILVAELNQVGYTCDYGWDASPHDLRPLTNEEKEEMSLLTI